MKLFLVLNESSAKAQVIRAPDIEAAAILSCTGRSARNGQIDITGITELTVDGSPCIIVEGADHLNF